MIVTDEGQEGELRRLLAEEEKQTLLAIERLYLEWKYEHAVACVCLFLQWCNEP